MGKHKLLIMLLCGFLAFAGGMFLRMQNVWHPTQEGLLSFLEEDSQKKEEDTYLQLIKEQGRFNVLVIGEDNVEKTKRSDTILLVSIDIDDKNIRVVSLPRDLRVMIPGHGTQKLNHAYAFGRQDLLKTTIERYLSLPILYCVIVDYDGFPAFIDALGGVDIHVDKKMRYRDRAGNLDIRIMPGLQHMDGKIAMHYVRFRHDALGDIGRIQRQQKFIKTVITKIYAPSTLTNVPLLIRGALQLFRTDMSPSYAIGLANFIQKEIPQENIFFAFCPGEPAKVNQLSYWIGDIEAVNAFLTAPLTDLQAGRLVKVDSRGRKTKIPFSAVKYAQNSVESVELDAENSGVKSIDPQLLKSLVEGINVDIAVLNGDGRSGICKEVAKRLQILGVDVRETGNAKHFDYNFSNIIYPENASVGMKNTAKMLGTFFGVANNLIRASNQAHCVSIVLGHDYKTTILDTLDRYLMNKKNKNNGGHHDKRIL